MEIFLCTVEMPICVQFSLKLYTARKTIFLALLSLAIYGNSTLLTTLYESVRQNLVQLMHSNHDKFLFCFILTAPGNIHSKVSTSKCLQLVLRTSDHTIEIKLSSKTVYLKAKMVNNTWAKHCDKHVFAVVIPNEIKLKNNYTVNNSRMQSIELNDPIPLLHPAGLVNDTYLRLSDKVFLTYKHIYKRYNDYDWYLKAVRVKC